MTIFCSCVGGHFWVNFNSYIRFLLSESKHDWTIGKHKSSVNISFAQNRLIRLEDTGLTVIRTALLVRMVVTGINQTELASFEHLPSTILTTMWSHVFVLSIKWIWKETGFAVKRTVLLVRMTVTGNNPTVATSCDQFPFTKFTTNRIHGLDFCFLH